MQGKAVVVGLLVIFTLPACLRAQTASMGGTITDSTGARIPNAKITAQNVDTGEARAGQTDESGVYRITNLNPGVYDITIVRAGFNTVLYSRIPLSVDQVLSLDAKLEVSAVRETIRVASESVAPVDLNDAQITNLVDSRQMADLPLILRDPYQLVLLSPGVTHVALESTGVYWKPVYYALEADCVVVLANARHVAQVPGRKTDVRDSAWLAQLLEHGLIRGSFVPPPPIRALRVRLCLKRVQNARAGVLPLRRRSRRRPISFVSAVGA